MTNPNMVIGYEHTAKDSGRIKDAASKIGKVLGISAIIHEPIQPADLTDAPVTEIDLDTDAFSINIRQKSPQTD